MTMWEKRPPEVANLLNPAFCGEVILRCIEKYVQTLKQPFPYPLVFLVLPIVLHKRTRESISSTKREQLHVWLQSNQERRIEFSQRAQELIPFTRETMTFLLQSGNLEIDSNAGLSVNKYHPEKIPRGYTQEIDDCFVKSDIVGRWFARAGSPTTIFTMWGVRP